jgi:hypothetical protein
MPAGVPRGTLQKLQGTVTGTGRQLRGRVSRPRPWILAEVEHLKHQGAMTHHLPSAASQIWLIAQ